MSNSGLDLKDIVGADNKLEIFINSAVIDNSLNFIPKMRPELVYDLNKVGIDTTNKLIGKFAGFNFEYKSCVDWLRKIKNEPDVLPNINNLCKNVVVVVLYRLEMAGLFIPKVEENWRHY